MAINQVVLKRILGSTYHLLGAGLGTLHVLTQFLQNLYEKDSVLQMRKLNQEEVKQLNQ